MDKVFQNLKNIETWVDFNSPPPDFGTNTEFMKFAVEIMNRCLYLLKTGIATSPDAEAASKGYTKHKAIIVGHMVRLAKLYEGALIHICGPQLELALVFFRPIFETAVRIEYLINSKSKRKSGRSFILASYRPEKEILQDLKHKAKERPLIQIEKRMKRKIVSRLKKDGISQTELLNNKTWNVDGKNFRDIMKILGRERLYAYGFGRSSQHVHGDWYEMDLYHLNREGRYYTPDLRFDEPEPRLACPLTRLCLNTLSFYLEWNKSDPNGLIISVAAKLYELNHALDDAQENTLGE